eukprot:gene4686-6399_t
MRRIVWSPTAIRDLAKIRAFVARFSPVAAARITSDLQAAGETLAAHADRGSPAPGGTRELATLRPCLIRYRVTTDDIRIIRKPSRSRRRSGPPRKPPEVRRQRLAVRDRSLELFDTPIIGRMGRQNFRGPILAARRLRHTLPEGHRRGGVHAGLAHQVDTDAGRAGALTGISIAEAGNTAGLTFTAAITDKTGQLTVVRAGTATVTGNGSKNVTVSGSLSDVN